MKKTAKKLNTRRSREQNRGFPWKSMVMAAVLCVALVYLGALLPRREDRLYQILWLCDCALILLFYGANWLYLRRVKRWQQRGERNLQAVKEELEARKHALEADLERAAARLNRRLIWSWSYYALLLVVVCGNILLHVPAGTNFFTVLLAYYILWSLMGVWFHRTEPQRPELELYREDYPTLYDLADRAAETVGCRQALRIFAGGQSASIVQSGRELWLLLDAVACSLFTKGELYQAMLHEFAHACNGDTRHSRRFSREMDRWGAETNNAVLGIGAYLLRIPEGLVTLEYYFYSLFANKYREIQADQSAVRLGSAQDFVNGLAKLCVWDIFEEEPNPEISLYWEYSAPEPREDYPAHALRVFRAALPMNQERWRHRLDVELPPRVSTHPIFRERREAFGITEYRFDTLERDEAYLLECEQMLAVSGKFIAKQMAKSYEEDRKSIYLDRKALIDHAKEITDWNAVSMDERIELAKALAVLEPELQETAIQSILAEDPESNYGTMLLAVKRFRERDPACVELLKLAAKRNHNFTEDAYDMLGQYAAANGLKELLEEYRSDVTGAVQESMDTDRELCLSWSRQERLTENSMEPTLAEEIRRAVVERTEGKLERLYAVQKETSGGPGYFYVLQFPESMPQEERDRLYDKVFLYLDYREELFSLYDVTGQPKRQEYLLKKVPGCLLATE